jgi:subtilisin family serine protease
MTGPDRPGQSDHGPGGDVYVPPAPETTGRYVVVFADEVGDASAAEQLRSIAGAATVASSRDFTTQGVDLDQATAADAVVFSELGLAVVSVDVGQLAALEAAASTRGPILAVEPEVVFHLLPESGLPESGVNLDYVRGYRDAVTDLYAQLAQLAQAGETRAAATPTWHDSGQATWGLQATKVTTSPWTGEGMKLAVLDTGLDLNHPDLTGRKITAQSFVPGQPAQDGHGHGTHCIGTATGLRSPASSRRYGIASAAEIFVGKVLNDQGRGTDSSILAGIDWAVSNGCEIVSMSLGASVRAVSQRYQAAGSRALAAGSLVIAAAGNNAHRAQGDPGFVGVPANSPSIMAVAALDAQPAVASFSARSNPVDGGQVDIAAPGVQVYSSWRLPSRYNTINGTSMATPHVAGVAALWAEATGHRAGDLWSSLVQAASRLQAPSVDVGAGLVQAPQ